VDRLSPAARSLNMSKVKNAGTMPELFVRKHFLPPVSAIPGSARNSPARLTLFFRRIRLLFSFMDVSGTDTTAVAANFHLQMWSFGRPKLPKINSAIAGQRVSYVSWGGTALTFGNADSIATHVELSTSWIG
jgi:hypothetical protein